MTDQDTTAERGPWKRYLGPRGRQVHVAEYAGPEDLDWPPLFCLHATAYSGRSFQPLMRTLSARRRVAAADTPGYGGSDRPAERIGIEGYAARLGEALAAEGPLDLLGYHTGALVAGELARQRPELVRRLVLIGVPFFTGAEREHWRGVLAGRMALTEDLDQFEERWGFFITRRHPGVSLERGFDNFVDELRAYPHGWWAHDAAFTFDVEACFAAVRQPTLVLNPHNHLAEASRHAARVLPQAQIVELPHLDHAIFDVAPEELAERIDDFLSQPASPSFPPARTPSC